MAKAAAKALAEAAKNKMLEEEIAIAEKERKELKELQEEYKNQIITTTTETTIDSTPSIDISSIEISGDSDLQDQVMAAFNDLSN